MIRISLLKQYHLQFAEKVIEAKRNSKKSRKGSAKSMADAPQSKKVKMSDEGVATEMGAYCSKELMNQMTG